MSEAKETQDAEQLFHGLIDLKYKRFEIGRRYTMPVKDVGRQAFTIAGKVIIGGDTLGVKVQWERDGSFADIPLSELYALEDVEDVEVAATINDVRAKL